MFFHEFHVVGVDCVFTAVLVVLSNQAFLLELNFVQMFLYLFHFDFILRSTGITAFLSVFEELVDDVNEFVSKLLEHAAKVDLVAGDFADEVIERANEGVELVH